MDTLSSYTIRVRCDKKESPRCLSFVPLVAKVQGDKQVDNISTRHMTSTARTSAVLGLQVVSLKVHPGTLLVLPSASLAVHDYARSYCFCPLQAHVIPYGQKVRTTVLFKNVIWRNIWYSRSLAHAEPQSETKWILHGMGGVGLGWP